MSNPIFATESYIGSGRVFVDGRRVGNCSEVKLSYSLDKKTQPNYEGGGGNLASRDKITGVTLDLTCFNWSADNIALALQATVSSVVTAAVTAEPHSMAINTLVDTDFLLDPTKTITVKTAGGTPVTIPKVAGNGQANYEVSAAGITFLAGPDVVTALASAESKDITIDYSKAPHTLLQALLGTGKEMKLVMDGVNDDTGRPVVVKVWRWKPSPTDGLNLISDDYATFALKGEVLADVSKPQGKSQFFEAALASAA